MAVALHLVQPDHLDVSRLGRRSDGSKQVRIAGADHHFTGKEKELAAVIRDFVSSLK